MFIKGFVLEFDLGHFSQRERERERTKCNITNKTKKLEPTTPYRYHLIPFLKKKSFKKYKDAQ